MILLLTACFMFHGNGGSSGNEGSMMPPTCKIMEQSDVPLDANAEGFDFAPAAMIGASEGVWTGWYDVDSTDANALTDGRLQLTYADPHATLVTSELAGTRSCDAPSPTCLTFSTGLYEEFSEPSPECPTRYELLADATFTGDSGSLDEALALTVTALPEFLVNTHALYVYGTVPLEGVNGTARPSWDTAEWQTTALQLRAAFDESGTLYGSTSWISTGGLTEAASDEGGREENLGGFSLSRE